MMAIPLQIDMTVFLGMVSYKSSFNCKIRNYYSNNQNVLISFNKNLLKALKSEHIFFKNKMFCIKEKNNYFCLMKSKIVVRQK